MPLTRTLSALDKCLKDPTAHPTHHRDDAAVAAVAVVAAVGIWVPWEQHYS